MTIHITIYIYMYILSSIVTVMIIHVKTCFIELLLNLKSNFSNHNARDKDSHAVRNIKWQDRKQVFKLVCAHKIPKFLTIQKILYFYLYDNCLFLKILKLKFNIALNYLLGWDILCSQEYLCSERRHKSKARLLAIYILITVSDVQEGVLLMMLLKTISNS